MQEKHRTALALDFEKIQGDEKKILDFLKEKNVSGRELREVRPEAEHCTV